MSASAPGPAMPCPRCGEEVTLEHVRADGSERLLDCPACGLKRKWRVGPDGSDHQRA